ncbi:MAG: glucose-6-phosphate isomerase [Actinomycetales bacterium]|nr:glucose-6-phosphate isomerase [Actinomycetales bacterium]
MEDITASPEWLALAKHQSELAGVHLRRLFAEDPGRGTELSATAGDVYLDYSKHRVTRETLRLLTALAERAGVRERTEAMFRGDHINGSEDRAVLHVALRIPRGGSLVVDGVDVAAEVHAVLDRMAAFTERVHSGDFVGCTGRPIRTVVNIGIGGSDLGPLMAYEALRDHHQPGLECRFVSNLDPTDLEDALAGADPEQTLFIVSSKTFTTVETLTNARVARQWLTEALGTGPEVAARHIAAVSAAPARAAAFGVDPELVFPMFDWVGGRYSFDSAIGLSLMLGIGRGNFEDLLAGLHLMDEHFRTAPFAENVPVIQALLGVWYTNFFGAATHAVLPYSSRLRRFPAYLQQLTMESNGKRVRVDGSAVTTDTGEIYWGEPGTNGQHAFYQLLHQGTWLVPSDFIGFAEPSGAGRGDFDLFTANMLAQGAALAFGKTVEEVEAEGTRADVVPHRVMPGNQPSSTILMPRLTPSTLGQLVALYEHTVFVKGVIWGINPFDQWGVELGKVMATRIAPELAEDRPAGGASGPGLDASTTELIRRYRVHRGRGA